MQGSKDDGFYLIWLYWVKKYMTDKIRPKDSIHQVISQLKKHYTLQALDSKEQLSQKLAAVKESRYRQQWPIYLIDPIDEIKHIESNLHQQYEQYRNEIYSYYLNIKNIFIIYRTDWQGSQKLSSKGDSFQGRNNDNISQGNRLYKSMIRPLDNRTEGNKSRIQMDNSSIINRIFYSCLEHQSNARDSLCQTVEHKIEDLQILEKIRSGEEFQVWNCKYKNIPHSYLKIKNQDWNQCLKFPLMHPSQPKCIGQGPIIPQIQPLQPGMDKLLPFVSYLKLLDKYFPGYTPTIGSIFQMNDLPFVLSKDCQHEWSEDTNVALLCYYVVYGDDGNLTSVRVERWAEINQATVLGGVIKEMGKRRRERKKDQQQNQKKRISLFENDQDGFSIW